MAKDPAFLFYPGDYLRDTQCLSESVQVAYDRIMCEHMRNICISQQQLNFFTKRLSEDEKLELEMVLTKVDGGFQIAWVAESICKRKAYSSSRSENRKGKNKEDMINISDTYVEHMVNENENVIEDKEENKEAPEKRKSKKPIIPTEEEFMAYYKSELSKRFPGLEFNIKAKYEQWVFDGWKDGFGKEITNWKTKIKNAITHMKTQFDPNRPAPIIGTPTFSSKNMNR
jgi:hypothetical protein